MTQCSIEHKDILLLSSGSQLPLQVRGKQFASSNNIKRLSQSKALVVRLSAGQQVTARPITSYILCQCDTSRVKGQRLLNQCTESPSDKKSWQLHSNKRSNVIISTHTSDDAVRHVGPTLSYLQLRDATGRFVFNKEFRFSSCTGLYRRSVLLLIKRDKTNQARAKVRQVDRRQWCVREERLPPPPLLQNEVTCVGVFGTLFIELTFCVIYGTSTCVRY